MESDHRHLYKKTADADELRKRREETSVGIRRNQRAESLQKRRQFSTPTSEPADIDFTSDQAAAYNTAVQAQVRRQAPDSGARRALRPGVAHLLTGWRRGRPPPRARARRAAAK